MDYQSQSACYKRRSDIDCMYHFALSELIQAVKEVGSEDAIETLDTLVQGRRLKDISDLPLDLAV